MGRSDFTRKVKPMELALMLLQLGGGARASIPALVANASPFSKAVLLLLVVLSVWSWAVIWDRMRLFGRVARDDAGFLAAFRQLPAQADCRLVAAQHPRSVLAKAALAGQRTLEQLPAEAASASLWELAQRALDRAAGDEVGQLERHVGFLAT